MPLVPFLNTPRQLTELLSRRSMLQAGLLPLLLCADRPTSSCLMTAGVLPWQYRSKVAKRASIRRRSARMAPRLRRV